MSLRALYEHFPCLQITFSSNSNAGFTLLGVFDARAVFGLRLNDTCSNGTYSTLTFISSSRFEKSEYLWALAEELYTVASPYSRGKTYLDRCRVATILLCWS
jgi:hypothetical protein